MPYLDPTTALSLEVWQRARSRILIAGQPNMGKTVSLGTFDPPVHVVNVPGELGGASIHEMAIRHDFAPPNPAVPRAWMQDWLDTVNRCVDIANGKYGPCATLAIEGLHKFYTLGLNVVTNGVNASIEGEFEARRYGNAWNIFKQKFLDVVIPLPIPTIVMTCWVELEADDPQDKSKDAAKSQLPKLPGKAATDIMGEFSVVLYAMREGTGQGARFWWMTQPQGRVKAAGIKAPLAISRKIPPRVPQDWQALKPLLGIEAS